MALKNLKDSGLSAYRTYAENFAIEAEDIYKRKQGKKLEVVFADDLPMTVLKDDGANKVVIEYRDDLTMEELARLEPFLVDSTNNNEFDYSTSGLFPQAFSQGATTLGEAQQMTMDAIRAAREARNNV
jgi:hypothetical protein